MPSLVSNRKLRNINLASNNLTNKSGVLVFEFICNANTIREINLCFDNLAENRIGDKGLDDITKAFSKNKSIRVLELSIG